MTTQATPAKPIWKRWWVIAIVVIVLLAVIGNLMGGDDETAAPETTPAPTATSSSPSATGESSAATTPAAAPAEPADQCVPVSDEVALHMAQAIDETAAAGKVGAVKAGESWVVAVEVVGGDVIDGDRAVFETVNVESPSLMKGVDGMAHKFTGLPESAFSVADDETDAAIACMG